MLKSRNIVEHPLEAFLLTARKAPVTTAGSDVLLLGGSNLIPYRPDGGGRTGVVAISPTHEGGHTQIASEIHYIEIWQGLQCLIDGNIYPTIVKQAREKHWPSSCPVMKESSEVAQGWIERGANSDLLVEGCSDDGQGSTLRAACDDDILAVPVGQ